MLPDPLEGNYTILHTKKLTKLLGKEWGNKNSFTIVSHHTTKHITVMCGKHSSSSDFFDTKLLLKMFSSCGLRSRLLESESNLQVIQLSSHVYLTPTPELS